MCQQPPISQVDPGDVDEFAESLLTTLNHGSLCLMLSLGHRTGLFDRMAELPPSTSAEIATVADLNERYVREWLGAMTTGRVVVYDPDTERYSLPATHAASLTRGGDNIAAFAQYVSILGQVEDDILECFRQGGGVPYERFGRFHEVMAEDSGQSVLPHLIESILPLATGLPERLAAGIDVVDVGCGRGRALVLMAEAYPKSRFVGLDLSADAIATARAEAEQKGLDNLEFAQRDVTDFDSTADEARFDLVTTFDAIHDQADPLAVLKGICRTLKDDGVYLMQDIHGSSLLEENLDHPAGTFLYTISTMHCMTVSLAQDGAGLGTMWGRQLAVTMLREAGFHDVHVTQLEHDFQNDYYVIRKQ